MRRRNPSRKTTSQRDRSRMIELAAAATAKECRRRGIKLWHRTGLSGCLYTGKAQDIFNRAYDYYEAEILAGRERSAPIQREKPKTCPDCGMQYIGTPQMHSFDCPVR